MNKIQFRVHLGRYFDETGELCQWHVAEKHYLESWSDTRAFDGTISIVQPLIQPLYDGKNAHELAQLFFRENYDKKDYDIIKENWQRQGFGSAPKTMATTATTTNQPPVNNQSATTQNRIATTTASTVAAQTTNPAQTQNANTGAATSGKNSNGASRNFDDMWRKVVHDGFVPIRRRRRNPFRSIRLL